MLHKNCKMLNYTYLLHNFRKRRNELATTVIHQKKSMLPCCKSNQFKDPVISREDGRVGSCATSTKTAIKKTGTVRNNYLEIPEARRRL